MSGSPLHPAIVHLPLGLALLLPLLALGLLWATRSGRLPSSSWAVVAVAMVLVPVFGFVSMQLGERDEERVEKVVPESAIETHEERAEAFTYTAAVAAALGIAGWLMRGRAQGPMRIGAAAMTLVVAGLGIATGQSGGELVYGHNAGAAWSPRAAGEASVGRVSRYDPFRAGTPVDGTTAAGDGAVTVVGDGGDGD